MMSFLSPSTEKLNPLFLLLFLHFIPTVNAQVATGQSDRTQQELALLGWTAGVRSAYCQQASPQELIPIFRESIARMLNRHCRNPSVCGLKKPVTFTKHQVVLLDGFPRREYRALSFRFFVVLPHEAIPLDKKPDKPLLSSLVLSEMLDGQMAELTHGLGWQVLSREKYPRFDPTTTFFNRSLILIAVIAGLCMIFLAYWVSSLTSGSSLYADGWLVRGSSGGKNAALRRTMEIIEEQKYRFALYDSQKGALYSSAGVLTPKTVVIYKTNARVQEMVAPPKSLATSYSSPQAAEVNRAMPIFPAAERKGPAADHPTHHPQRTATSSIQVQPRAESVKKPIAQREQQPPMGQMQPSMPVAHQAVLIPPKSRTSLSTNDSNNSARRSKPQQQTTFDEQEMAEMGDCVPEIVVMHARDSSMDTVDTTTTPGGSRKLSSSQGDRRKSRRFSIAEEFKRRKSFFGGSKDRADSRARGGNQQERQKRWKASSIALSKFSIVGSSGQK